MVDNNWLMQFLADILGLAVDRPSVTETTALGAAYLAGLQAGLFPSTGEVAGLWRREAEFTPRMPAELREDLYDAWLAAVARVRTVA